MNLRELPIGRIARIKSIKGDINFKNRLNDLGIFVGRNVQVLRVAPLFDPLEIKIKCIRVAIRKKDAQFIEVIPYD